MITVTCRKRDELGCMVLKYDNLDEFAITPEKPVLPNGVYGYRHLRNTDPVLWALTPVARWLYEQMDGSVFSGLNKKMYGKKLMVYNGKTVGAMLRADALQGYCNGSVWSGADAVKNASERAENVIKCYNLDKIQAKIEEYLFPIIEVEETDPGYWNRVAEELPAGTTRLVVVDRPVMEKQTETEYVMKGE